MMKNKKIIFTSDQLKKMNTPDLKNIPNIERYQKLINFLNQYNKKEDEVILRHTSYVPTKQKHSFHHHETPQIFRGLSKTQSRPRQQLISQKTDTDADRINNEIRDLLSKISEENKNDFLKKFNQLDIINECGQTLIDNIY